MFIAIDLMVQKVIIDIGRRVIRNLGLIFTIVIAIIMPPNTVVRIWGQCRNVMAWISVARE